jgi:hypothetical protein
MSKATNIINGLAGIASSAIDAAIDINPITG